MGRIYSSAFLGGHKNEKLVTDGIYSVMRNPLYFFSLIGVTGAALISNHLVIIIALPVLFFLLYIPLIKREEKFLTQEFGDEYLEYKNKVPALFPRISNYNAPDTLTFYPKFLSKAFADAIWWISIFPIVEIIEFLQDTNILPRIFIS